MPISQMQLAVSTSSTVQDPDSGSSDKQNDQGSASSVQDLKSLMKVGHRKTKKNRRMPQRPSYRTETSTQYFPNLSGGSTVALLVRQHLNTCSVQPKI